MAERPTPERLAEIRSYSSTWRTGHPLADLFAEVDALRRQMATLRLTFASPEVSAVTDWPVDADQHARLTKLRIPVTSAWPKWKS